jgi:hypothetical protein
MTQRLQWASKERKDCIGLLLSQEFRSNHWSCSAFQGKGLVRDTDLSHDKWHGVFAFLPLAQPAIFFLRFRNEAKMKSVEQGVSTVKNGDGATAPGNWSEVIESCDVVSTAIQRGTANFPDGDNYNLVPNTCFGVDRTAS